jgi:hypothetical protein
MAERPIVFTGESVRSILDGRKTQTRQVVKLREFQRSDTRGYDYTFRDRQLRWHDYRTDNLLANRAPYRIGDRLWVKETFLQSGGTYLTEWGEQEWTWSGGRIEYCADGAKPRYLDDGRTWMMKRPSVHMWRKISRLTLEVLSVRVERVQDITEEDARAEGVRPTDAAIVFEGKSPGTRLRRDLGMTSRGAFACAWDRIHGKRVPWASAPWVWVIAFRRVSDA